MASNSARLIVGDVQKDLRKEPELVEETNSVTNSGKNWAGLGSSSVVIS